VRAVGCALDTIV